jgi:hypothetical protein
LDTGDLAEWHGADLCWTGRSDCQVKILGQKLNLDRLNATISNLLDSETFCLVDDQQQTHHQDEATNKDYPDHLHQHQDAIIVTFVLVDINKTESEIMKVLRSNLKTQELPAKLVFLKQFPLNRHNKIDRIELRRFIHNPQPKNCSQNSSEVQSPVYIIAKVWGKLLGEEPKEEDYFISMGGDSFLAVNLVNQIKSLLPNIQDNLFQVLLQKSFKDIKRFVISSLENNIEYLQNPVKRVKLTDEIDETLATTSKNESEVLNDVIIVKCKARGLRH